MKVINKQDLTQTVEISRIDKRLRKNYNIHESLDETVHKLLNVLQPGTVLPIHRHLHPPKKETIVLLQGSLIMELYDENKQVVASYELSKESGNFICEIYPEEWHTYFPLEKDTLVLGIKEGPYIPYKDIDVLK